MSRFLTGRWDRFGTTDLCKRRARDSGMTGEFITLARVVKTQGRHGEVASEILSDVPDRFKVGMKLWALPRQEDSERRELEIEELWPHKRLLVLKFVGVDSISEAETLIGNELQVPGSQRAQLEAGWSYVSDLIGCKVVGGGREVGRIEDIQFGAGEAPLLIVRGENGALFEIPFAEAYLKSLDVRGKLVRMNLPEGLLDVNAPVTAEEKRLMAAGRKKRNKRRGRRTFWELRSGN
jgi:16S rRNA processing protein RimM